MFWSAGLVFVALALGQVSAQLSTPVYIEDAIAKAASAADSRIVSGWEARLGEHPHQVSLRLVGADGGVSACGGSVVARSWVISAAHCTASRITTVVRAGVVSLTTPQYIFETTEWWNYPTFDETNPNVVQVNDISIIKLQRPVTYTDVLKPIRIQPTRDAFRNYANEVVYASGWGRTWTNGAQPEVLNWVYLRAIANLECAMTFGATLITDNAICARWFNVTSQSTCQGDSGGPLVHAGADGVPVLVGIASFVAGGTWGCHSGLPAGFIRPGPFIPWLNEITGLDFDNLNEEDEVTEAPTTQTPPNNTTTTTTTTEGPTNGTTTVTTEGPTNITTTTTESPTNGTTTITEGPTNGTTTTTPTPESEEEEEEEEDDDSDDSDESDEDPELSELLKKLIVKVKVKVKINNNVKRKIKVKCVDKF